MRYPVRLFLGNEEVEFNAPPDILFNYSETELVNPTIVKNSYSKTITIEGTKHNNKIFGHFYDMQRIQGYDGRTMGSSFNPLVKTDFTLYLNSSIYESGYFKLDEVRRNNNNIEYDISLFGGLGDFFYNLSFREDGTPMELSDLIFEHEVNGGNLDFKINKETVKDAWLYMWQTSSKWDTFNFAPCLNGKPTNIAADKFLINNYDVPVFDVPASGYSLGTSEHEHTEWETFDLRSYLQRPVVRVREIIKAICNPENNGGYNVNLDYDFFTTENQYYWDSWMTLPLLPNLDIPATVESALTVSAITQESNNLYTLWDGGANASNVQIDVDVKFTPTDGYSGDSIYLSKEYDADGGFTLQTRFAKYFANDSTVMIQMIGYNESGQMSTFSNLYRLITPRKEDILHQPTANWCSDKFVKAKPDGTTVSSVSTVYGKFTKKNGSYVFTDMSGNTQTLRFTFPSTAEFTKLKLKIVPYFRTYFDRTWVGSSDHYDTEGIYTWSRLYRYSDYWQDLSLVETLDKVEGNVSYEPIGATGTTISFEGFYSNREYKKKDLLTLGVTPADFLLSYAKIFGLYFIKDVEKKEIRILTRHSFYKRDEIVNINDLIDKGSNINIIPNTPKYQYYDFSLDQVDSEAAESYRKTYGNEYGTATVNTGYQYEKEHKKLLENNIFKAGINVTEKNKYYQKPIQGIPCLVFNGFSYTYTETGETVEKTITPESMTGEIINPDGLKYYGFRPMPQFHTADNEASDGSMVLLFCTSIDYNAGNYGFKLTDDLEQMYTLNDGQPCWIISNGTTDSSGNTIALEIDRMPLFSRDDYPGNGYIRHSMDLGTPLTTYVPYIYASDWQSIYSKAWKSYIADLYNVNTRILKCKCLLRERPNPEWMRRFYWFNNSYWRLNSIKDWDISSFDTTEMEFIKVEDISNYDSVHISYCPIIEYRGANYIVNSGGTIDATIYVSDGTSWTFNGEVNTVTCVYADGTETYYQASDIVSPLSGYGTMNAQVHITLPANTSGMSRTFYFTLEDDCEHFHNFNIQQESAWSGATISPTSLSFADSGGTGTLTISSPSGATWTLDCISGDTSWITMSVVSSSATQTIYSVTASENTGATRNLIYEFESNGYVTNVMISQTANSEAYITPTSLSFEASGGTLNVYVSDPTNHGWTLVPSDSWINPTYTANTGSAIFAITATTNSGAARNATLTFRDNTKTGTTTVTVSQASGATPVLDYLAFDIISGGTIIWNHTYELEGSALTIYYSVDNGTSWNALISQSGVGTGSTNTIYVSAGDKVLFKGTNDTYSINDSKYLYFKGTAKFNLSGNILSLIYGDNFIGQTGVTSGFSTAFLFYLNKGIINASGLTLPSVVTSRCYKGMFEDCYSLETAPKLPAITLADSCYSYMFNSCYKLTTPPELPATTLANRCYLSMFNSCALLTTAPELPAKTLVDYCYTYMFNNCVRLNYIKCLATDISATECTRNWVGRVNSTGTFVKDANMSSWTTGDGGIPTNWTVVNDGPIWNCYLDFSYGNVTATQTGTWDEYDIYYSNTPNNPVETGSRMMSIDCGGIIYQGHTWNPTDATSWTVISPFGDAGSVSQVEVPESLAGHTIYLRVEFGSVDIGTAIYSTVVEVQIPQNGGTVNVTIPQF